MGNKEVEELVEVQEKILKSPYYPSRCPIKDNCKPTGIVFCLEHSIGDYRNCDIYEEKTSKEKLK